MAAPTRAELMGYAQRVAVQYGIDPSIFLRQIQQESGFDPNAKNPSGATGIAQLMPQYYPNAGQDPFADLDSMARTDAANLKRFGSYPLMLAAYDAGAGAVEKAGGVPPYAETQRYVSAIMGGGGNTMDSNQPVGGTTDELGSLFDQAINGTSPGTVPDGQLSPGQPAALAQTADQTPVDGITILRMIEAKLGGGEAQATISKPTIKDPTGSGFGDIPNPETITRYTWPTGQYVDIVQPRTGSGPAYVKGGTALKSLSTGTTPDTKTFPDGTLRQYDPNSNSWTVIGTPPAATDKAPKTINTKGGSYQYDPQSGWSLIPGTEPASARVQIHQMPDGSLAQYDPDSGQWTTIQGRYVDPTEQAYKQALTAEASANAQKTQLSLRPTAQAAIQDAYATIGAIQQQIASGKMSPTEGDTLMQQVHQGLSATLAGTTLFEQQKQAQDVATQRAQTASAYLNQRVSSAASLGSTLFNAAKGVYLPAGKTSLGIDPLAIANQEVNQMGGGQQTGNAAAAFLASVFGGQAGPGAGSPAGALGQPSFPTTRDAVLAAYPHLAQGGVQPQVQPQVAASPVAVPPRPLSPMNQAIQAGG